MATLHSSDQTIYGTKLMRLIIDKGTEALRNVFQGIHSGNLKVVLSSNKHILSKLKVRIINQKQWNKLYPTPPEQPDINEFDITLLCVLLRNICGLSLPSSGWDKMPNVSDHTREADIIRIKLFRNERFGHISRTAVSMADFIKFWAEISAPLVRLGIDEKEIDRLANEKCGEDVVSRVSKEWNECNDKIMNALNDEKVLNNSLVQCDFQREIDIYYAKFTEGTREWVFVQVLTWFNDKNSENRVFFITGNAGMGKSIIAAAICKRFAEHVGACHFFQYNNNQYNNPKFFLQSLAWHLCKALPTYKDALVEKLSGNLGRSLNDKNIEGLFSILLKEPLCHIQDPGKHIMIVLDAVDESEYNERQDFANLIASHLHKLPSYIRFVITTRPVENLLNMFVKLNPLYIEPDDERNLNDLKLVLSEKIRSPVSADLIDSLATKSQGLMLYAFFLTEMYQGDYSMSDISSFPKGIEDYYENYFQRLERELKTSLEISDDKFLNFLSVLAVAKESLPEAFVAAVFGFEGPVEAKRKTTKAINTVSLLLVIHKDKSVSFMHKSVRDWLVDRPRHNFTVDVQYGHKTLFELCVKKLKNVKEKGVRKENLAIPDVKYALKYCIPHMLKGLEDAEQLESYVSDYFTDLEIVFAGVCVNVNLALDNLKSLKSSEISTHVSENTRTIVDKLNFLIRKFIYTLGQFPQTFLQNVVNEAGEPLSSKATKLLATRYKDILYLKMKNDCGQKQAIEISCILSGWIKGIDVSPKRDLVVCASNDDIIELFSLETGLSEWKIQGDRDEPPLFQENDCLMILHSIVFHPRENLILPGRLDKVLTLQGEFTKGPFHCDQDDSAFTSCCFSLDDSKMVTYYGDNLFVWDVDSGIKERCLSCNEYLYSLSFTASGDFLGTTDCEYVFSVYDVRNNYKVTSIQLWDDDDDKFPVEIISTFEQNSWLCSDDYSLRCINHDLTLSDKLGSACKVPLPGNLHSSGELERFVKNPDDTWLSRVHPDPEFATRYIPLGNKSVLMFSCVKNVVRVFNVDALMATKCYVYYLDTVDISTNGDFVYLNNERKGLTVTKLKNESFQFYARPKDSRYVVVKGGVISYIWRSPSTPVLWNSDFSQQLSSFHQLAGMNECLSVSDEVIACVYEYNCVKFFNVSTEQIVHEMSFDKPFLHVWACSIKYHAIMAEDRGPCFLWKDGGKINARASLFGQAELGQICAAEFSPEGNTLALSFRYINKLFIFDVASKRMLAPIAFAGSCCGVKYFDERNLVCSFLQTIYFINVERSEILACLDVGTYPKPISIGRKPNIVCAGLRELGNFQLLEIILPRM